MIYTIKKKIQILFKKFFYGLFKLIYNEIREFQSAENNPNTSILVSKIDENYKYKVFLVKDSRIYTDTINDTAIIQDNKIIEGPSFQIRNAKFGKIEENIVFSKGTPRIKKKIKGNLLSLLTGGAGNNNYWHWLFDVLPRLNIAKNVIQFDEIDYFLFPDLKKKFQTESLEILGIPKQKRLHSPKHRHISGNKIISTDHPYVINNDPSNEIQNLPAWIIKWLKKSLKNNINLEDNKYPKNIYIDRSDASPNIKKWRSIINEDEVLEEIIKKNYRNIVLSDLTLIEQMKYFFNAKNIIGLHGAGFANLIFGSKGSNVLELRSANAGDVIKNLAIQCGFNYNCIAVIPEKFNFKNQLGHIRVDINKLRKFL